MFVSKWREFDDVLGRSVGFLIERLSSHFAVQALSTSQMFWYCSCLCYLFDSIWSLGMCDSLISFWSVKNSQAFEKLNKGGHAV